MSKRSNDCLAQAQDDYTEYQCEKGKTLNTEYSNYIEPGTLPALPHIPFRLEAATSELAYP